MRSKLSIPPILLGICLLVVGAADAQVLTPSFMAPRQSNEVGVHLSDGFGGRGGLAVEGIWRRGMGAYDLGLRAGIGDVANGLVLLLGGEYRRPLALGADPVDVAATGGLQVGIGEASAVGMDIGLSLGSTFVPEGIRVTPYLHPRLAIVRGITHSRTDPSGSPVIRSDALAMHVLADLGVDVDVGGGFIIRLGLGFGSPTADFGIGLAWR